MAGASLPQNRKNGPEVREVLGVKVVGTSMVEVLRKIEMEIPKKSINRSFWVVTANAEMLVLADEDANYKEVVKSADMVIPDGVGLKLAGVGEIVPGRKLVEAILNTKKYRVFYLGGFGVAQKMARKYGGEGEDGYADIKKQIANSKFTDEIVKRINKYRPDILLVAYGMPWQERWIYQNLGKLKVKVVMGVGGTFDYLTGKYPLPPKWMEKMGLETLWRLVTQPWRWRRIWRAVGGFPWKLLESKMS